jgi:hypothetical protein
VLLFQLRGPALFGECEISYRCLGKIGTARGGRALNRPSGVTSYTSDGRTYLLVVEAGAMCVSVFELHLPTYISDSAGIGSTHVCDMCKNAIGSDSYAPHLGRWSWLSIACTPAGDVLVSDMDNECLFWI